MRACRSAVSKIPSTRSLRILSLAVLLLLSVLAGSQKIRAQEIPAESARAEYQRNVAAGEKAYGRCDFVEAERLLLAAVKEVDKPGGERNLDLARSLRDLGMVYSALSRPEEAEAALKRALAIRIAALPSDHPDITDILNLLSLVAKEKRLGPDHADVAPSLDNQAALYLSQGKAAEAEPLLRRSLQIREKALGPENPGVALSLNNLAEFYHTQGRHAEAEPLLKRSLEIREKVLGPANLDVAQSLNNLAELYESEGKHGEAEPLLKRSLAIYEKALGPDHPDVGQCLNNLAEFYRTQERYAEAEPLYKRSLAIIQKALGPDHPSVAAIRKSLALLYQSQGKAAQAKIQTASSPEEVARLLAIGPGRTVADIGTGDGEWTLDLAKRVGPEGRVFSNEIDSALLAGVREKVVRMGLHNVSLVLGSESDTGLPTYSCDAILMRLVYHHLTDPAAMRASLGRALRPGGRLVVIDFRPGNPNVVGEVPRDRGGHGIRPETVIHEMAGAGFELIRQIENWEQQNDRYCLVFRRK